MLRLVELHVRKYRDLVDGGPLRFGPGPVFLLGPNGSGKTTLLELIGVLLGDDLGPLFKEEDAVELSWVLEAEGEGETPATRLELSLSIDPVVRANSEERTARRARRWWRASGVLPARQTNEQSIHFSDGSDGDMTAKLDTGESLLLGSPPESVGAQHAYWLNQLRFFLDPLPEGRSEDIEGADRLFEIIKSFTAHHSTRLDEANVLFDKIVGNHDKPVEIEELNAQRDTSHDLPSWVTFTTSAKSPRDGHPDLTLLTRLLGADRLEFRPRLVSDDGRGRRLWRGFDIYVHWGGGAIHHHSQLSFGQKRLIALIWRLGVGVPLPLLTDELTNGLHAGWVQAIIDHLGPRQGFHAVQNPLLLDRYGPGESAADVAGRFVLCTVETGERGRQWRWRSPTPEECERLWERFSTRYQPLSDVLLSEGLW